MKPAKKSQYVIETKDIMKCYGKEGKCLTTVLQDVNIAIEKGSFISIMGPSGSGKTTLLDIVGCLLKPTQGEVFIDGVKTGELTDDELAKIRRQKMGFVFQQYNLIPSNTALENVEIPLRIAGKSKWEAEDKAKRLLQMVGLGDRLTHKPSELSGGEQQRVAIARALANDPEIILGDEPTGNLDTKTGQVVLNILKKLNEEEGYTIVVVTHDSRIAQHADKIINLLDGSVVREDHPNGNRNFMIKNKKASK
ncbi:MAG: ABC transporter ATP-binding protein [Candidatus Aenigmarchaeota archaeon]|nr:ABC transporter ATP-binding protein [Candidatus Aenigmarchaeota archaeon]